MKRTGSFYGEFRRYPGHDRPGGADQLAGAVWANLFVKSEAFNPLGSVEDRQALGVIGAAEKSGELKPGQTVIEATSENTGIGLAMVCAARERPLVVTMAEPRLQLNGLPSPPRTTGS